MLCRSSRVPVPVLIGEVPHFGHESITASRNGRDEATLLGTFAEDFADRGNIHREINFFDERAWPHLLKKFVFCDHSSLISHKTNQGIERLRSEGNRGSIAREDAFDGVQYKTVEPVNLLVQQGHTAFKRSFKKFQRGCKDTQSRIALDHLQAAQIQKKRRRRANCAPTEPPTLRMNMQPSQDRQDTTSVASNTQNYAFDNANDFARGRYHELSDLYDYTNYPAS